MAEKQPLEELRKTIAYQNFRAQLLAHYQFATRFFSPSPGEKWLTYWFMDFSEQDFKEFAKQMINWAFQLPIQKVQYYTKPLDYEKGGFINVEIEQGLRLSEEMKELYSVLQTNHIATYIVTASPEILVESICYYLGVPTSQVFGMRVTKDTVGNLSPAIEKNWYITKGIGKVHVIKNEIAPLRKGKMPVLVFGDSQGDYEMLSQILAPSLSVLINRNEQNIVKNLIVQAEQEYNQSTAKIVVQGRDENKASFHPSTQSLLLKETE